MDPSIKPHYDLVRLNTLLFQRCLDGIDDETAKTRINDRINNVAFIASHVLDARYFLANFVGLEVTNPFKEVLAGLSSIEEFTDFPVVLETLAAWKEISPVLTERLRVMTPADFEKPSPQDFPIDDGTILGGIAFLVNHESYHLGQLGLLRKYFNLNALSFR